MVASTTNEPTWLGKLVSSSNEAIKATLAQERLFDDFFSYNAIVTYKQQQLHVVVRVRNALHQGLTQGSCCLHLNWVGGGFCTGGEPNFAAWHQCHFANLFTEETLMICPRYPLMPESSGAQILAYFDSVMSWIASTNFRDVIKQNSPLLKATIDNSELSLVSGDSAGAFAAFQSWFSDCGPKVKTLYFLYPMFATYGRDPEQDYMNEKQTRSSTEEKTKLMLVDMFRRGPLPPRIGSFPPVGMDAAYLSSSTKIRVRTATDVKLVPVWHALFQQPDILERLSQMAGMTYQPRHTSTVDPVVIHVNELVQQLDDPKVQLGSFGLAWEPAANRLALKSEGQIDQKPPYCPKIVIAHGTADTNCPIEHVEHFVDLVKILWPEVSLKVFKAAGEPHAFTYNRQDVWMMKVTDQVKLDIGL